MAWGTSQNRQQNWADRGKWFRKGKWYRNQNQPHSFLYVLCWEDLLHFSAASDLQRPCSLVKIHEPALCIHTWSVNAGKSIPSFIFFIFCQVMPCKLGLNLHCAVQWITLPKRASPQLWRLEADAGCLTNALPGEEQLIGKSAKCFFCTTKILVLCFFLVFVALLLNLGSFNLRR